MGCEHWVRYWLHTGHLYIEGRKMSKSLKNFISIQEFLHPDSGFGPHPATDFRILCLQQKYSATIHFSKERMAEASQLRHKLEAFLSTCRAAMASGPVHLGAHHTSGPTSADDVVNVVNVVAAPVAGKGVRVLDDVPRKDGEASRRLRGALRRCKDGVRAAMGDDFDTPTALRLLSTLMGEATPYAAALCATQTPTTADEATSPPLPLEPLADAHDYIVKILTMLGLEMSSLVPIQDCSYHEVRVISARVPAPHFNDKWAKKNPHTLLIDIFRLI